MNPVAVVLSSSGGGERSCLPTGRLPERDSSVWNGELPAESLSGTSGLQKQAEAQMYVAALALGSKCIPRV